MELWLTACLIGLSGLPGWGQSTGDLPFDLTESDLAAVQPQAVRWVSVRGYAGGVEGSLRYENPRSTLEECKALGLLGARSLVDRYRQTQEEAPVTFRLDAACGDYTGTVRYDGVNMRLEVRERETRSVVYSGSHRGLPSTDQDLSRRATSNR